jgi:beta-lactam-binding protein with PASTA domain
VSQVSLATVPNVLNLPMEDALARIETAGLTPGNVTPRDAPGPPDRVLNQSLKPGTRVARGTPLHLGVSQVQLVTVPNLLKLSIEDALAAIDTAGLTRGNLTPSPAPGPPDRVLNQSLKPGMQVARGTPLDLAVSQAQPAIVPDVPNPPVGEPPATPLAPAPLLVPDVLGRNVEEAAVLLGQAGLAVGTVTQRSLFLPPFFQPAGAVFQQQPAPGTALAAPVPISLVIHPQLPVWAVIVPSALLGAALGLLLRRRRPRLPANAPPQPPVQLPTIITRAYADPGDQGMPSVANPVSLEIRVRHTMDSGAQSVREVQPPFVRAAAGSPRRA